MRIAHKAKYKLQGGGGGDIIDYGISNISLLSRLQLIPINNAMLSQFEINFPTNNRTPYGRYMRCYHFSGNDLTWRQDFTWTSDDLLSIAPVGTKFSELNARSFLYEMH